MEHQQQEQDQHVEVGIFLKTSDKSSSFRLLWDLVNLCEAMKTERSLNAAVKKRGGSYGHAWTIFRRAEMVLGFPLLHKGSYAISLTPEAIQLVEAYKKASDKAMVELASIVNHCCDK